MRRLLPRSREEGQALVLFTAGIISFLAIVGLSVDVGRFLWARTQIQAAVDAAALAAAQSMPDQAEAAQQAQYFWDDNNDFLEAQAENLQFSVTYPPGNKAVRVEASAEIPTWFVRLVGFDTWHVSASGEAESKVLDIAIVLDVSGSMCFDTYPDVESGTAWMSPGRADRVPHLVQPIPAGGPNQITIYLDDVSIFNSTSSWENRQNFGYTSNRPYYQQNIGGRAGTIRIDNELFTIVSVNENDDSMVVRRAQQNRETGAWTSKQYHAAGAEVWANRLSCELAAYDPDTGPYEPFDTMVDAANYFITLFNSEYDKIGAAKYSTEGTVVHWLTSNFGAVQSSIASMGPPNGGTNIPHGIALGRQILDGSGKRANAVRVLVLLTDGVANHYCGSSSYNPSAYDSTSCNERSGESAAIQHSYAEAERAADGDIIIFTIGLGYGVDQEFLEEIAEIGGGKYYFSPTAEQLDEAFQAIAEQTHIALVR